jgi:hypothetical protein
MRPIPIPQFTPLSDKEKTECDEAKAIREHLLSQRKR